MDILEKKLASAEKDRQICTLEWCQATEEVIADLVRVIYNMHASQWGFRGLGSTPLQQAAKAYM